MSCQHCFCEEVWLDGVLWERCCNCKTRQILRFGIPAETENTLFEWPKEVQ